MSKFNAEEADNLEDIEKQFAVTAVEQASTYWSLLEKFPPASLKLTDRDNELYDDLVDTFPEFKEGIWGEKIDEHAFKSKEGKERWRKFCNKYEKTVADYNFGTLLRLDASKEYDQENTMFAYRVQFYAIEIFRNRHGFNDWIYDANHKK